MDGLARGESPDIVETLTERANWRAREVRYLKGSWQVLSRHIPHFEARPFASPSGTIDNPFLRQVVRLPLTRMESEVPIGVVSPRYTLAQHVDVAQCCMDALENNGFDISAVECELGLSELGEWMNFRVIFPEDYGLDPGDGHKVQLRLECFNSVDGSSRLQIRLSWLRLVCLNGMSTGETQNIDAIHNEKLDLKAIGTAVNTVLGDIVRQKALFRQWTEVSLDDAVFTSWIDETVADAWGKKAACRVFHICYSGWDVEFENPFEKKPPSRKSTRPTDRVPGAPDRAATYYDVAQALAWVATHRNDAEERGRRQADIARLMSSLEQYAWLPEGPDDLFG